MVVPRGGEERADISHTNPPINLPTQPKVEEKGTRAAERQARQAMHGGRGRFLEFVIFVTNLAT